MKIIVKIPTCICEITLNENYEIDYLKFILLRFRVLRQAVWTEGRWLRDRRRYPADMRPAHDGLRSLVFDGQQDCTILHRSNMYDQTRMFRNCCRKYLA